MSDRTDRTDTTTMPRALDVEQLLDFVAHDIWAYTGHEDDCSMCGPYEPCQACMKATYRPAADAVMETIRRADVDVSNDNIVRGGPSDHE